MRVTQTEMERERERELLIEQERLGVKWILQVVFEADLDRGAANASSVYMPVHALASDCVSLVFLHLPGPIT